MTVDFLAPGGRMSAPDHFRAAEILLREAYNQDDFKDTGRVLAGIGHALLACAAAVAPSVHASNPTKPWRAEFWPPEPGDIWQDGGGARWACLHDRTLACMAFQADDMAEEIWQAHGPMSLVARKGAREEEEECPF